MHPDRAMVLLLVCQGFVSASMLAFHLGLRPSLSASYAEAGASLSTVAALALGPLWMPGAAIGSFTLCLLAALVGRKRSRRLRVMAAALVVSGLSFIVGALSAVAPLFS